MCRRYARTSKSSQLLLPFKVEGTISVLEPSFNIAPSEKALAIVKKGENYRFAVFKWGLVPHWAGDPAKFTGLDNARAETVHKKPSFRDAFHKQRCLIVADGFYEWRAEALDPNLIGTSKGKPVKTPFYFQLQSEAPFAFAAIYDIWEPKLAGYASLRMETCALITCEPNGLMEPIHDRMPVILRPEDYVRWLDPETEETELLDLLQPYPPEEMKMTKVSRYVNYSKNKGPKCVEPDE